MNNQLKELKDIVSKTCITIILNTHRTRPDNEKDALILKNLMKEAEDRLYAEMSNKTAKHLMDRLESLTASIDHNQNLESLALFVNDEITRYIRLPISVENRVVINQSFATRDILRAIHLETRYYVLVLSKQKVRLLEAFNDKLVREITDSFPIDNDQYYVTSKEEESISSKPTRLTAKFFNIIDKELNKVRQVNPLPVLICTEESNYHEYLKVADHKDTIVDTFLNMNRLDETGQAIVSEAWEIMKTRTKKINEARIAELQQAVSQNKFLSDVNDIYQAIKEGRVQTLFIEKGNFQPAILEDDRITFVEYDNINQPEVIDDIYDELIEENMNYGGGCGVFTRWRPGAIQRIRSGDQILIYQSMPRCKLSLLYAAI